MATYAFELRQLFPKFNTVSVFADSYDEATALAKKRALDLLNNEWLCGFDCGSPFLNTTIHAVDYQQRRVTLDNGWSLDRATFTALAESIHARRVTVR